MAKRPEPTREEELQWLALTGRTQAECIDELYGPLPDRERRKVEARLRQRVRRARTGETPGRHVPPEPARLPPAPEPLPVAETDVDRETFLRRQLEALMRDVEMARSNGELRFVPTLDKRVSDVRAALDRELERSRRVVRLERTPGAISAELVRRRRAIEIRAELRALNEERARRAAERGEGGGDDR